MIGNFKVIDSHCHVYPEKIAAAAVSATDKFYDTTSAFDGSTSALLSQCEKEGVDHAVIQSVATTPHQVSSINRFIAKTVEQANGKFTGLGTLHPDGDIAADVKEIIALGLHGVKLHPDIQRFKIDDYRCLKIYELCEKEGLPILMHTGDNRYDYSNPNRLLPILDIYTDLVVIGAHLGGWSIWEEAGEVYPKYKNFYVDTSSTLSFCGIEVMKNTIEKYGADKVMFATDYPMGAQKTELEALLSMGFSDEDYKKIFSENAKKVFKIKTNI